MEDILVAAVIDTSSRSEESQTVSYNNAIQLVSVERTPTATGNRFAVKFTKSGDVFYRINDYLTPSREPDSVEEEAEGLWTARFTCNHTVVTDNVWFMIIDRDNDLMVSARLNNSEAGPAFEGNLQQQQPEVRFSPAEPATYRQGENVVYTAISPANPSTGKVIPHISAFFSGIDLDSDKFEIFMSNENLIDEEVEDSTSQEVRVTYTVLTSTRAVSGVLQFIAHAEDNDNPLVLDLQVTRHVAIRPASQSGEYPSGYLGIMEYPYMERSKNGNELHSCPIGYTCPLSCFAVGERVTSMFVYKVVTEDHLEEVLNVEDALSTSDTVHGIIWMFQATEDSGDSDGITTFSCRAYDTVDFRYVTKLLDVQATIPPSIDGQRSSVQVENDPVDPHTKIITFNCAIKGRPLPKVWFSGDLSPATFLSHESPDNITATPLGQDTAIASKVVTLGADELEQLIEHNGDGQQERPHCAFFNPFKAERVKHYFIFQASNSFHR
ncbi:hypothetical protein PoB_002057200 [Plakobranchus ocellatus]|uniref:Ig-like domain-containing protein n=1 Tax=Plakobranchus ocellatus TaxID=259542 RepID=A0AAV3ZFH6_9GAST|nr:hypothetical protein PoB_002057200 [Plakobranchus ocellatus]